MDSKKLFKVVVKGTCNTICTLYAKNVHHCS